MAAEVHQPAPVREVERGEGQADSIEPKAQGHNKENDQNTPSQIRTMEAPLPKVNPWIKKNSGPSLSNVYGAPGHAGTSCVLPCAVLYCYNNVRYLVTADEYIGIPDTSRDIILVGFVRDELGCPLMVVNLQT